MLLRLLKESGLTQKKVADKLGVDQGLINRWLSSASNLTINTFTKLMLAMGADLDDPSYTCIAVLIARDAASVPTAPSDMIAAEKQGKERAELPGILSTLEKSTSTGLTLDVLNQLNQRLKHWMEELPVSGASPAPEVPRGGNTYVLTSEANMMQTKPPNKNVVLIEDWLKKKALGAEKRKVDRVAS
jgi:transcriptional regulator with XRE-family HTH domain